MAPSMDKLKKDVRFRRAMGLLSSSLRRLKGLESAGALDDVEASPDKIRQVMEMEIECRVLLQRLKTLHSVAHGIHWDPYPPKLKKHLKELEECYNNMSGTLVKLYRALVHREEEEGILGGAKDVELGIATPTEKFTLRHTNTGELRYLSVPEILEMVNDNPAPEFEGYDESDWIEGLLNFSDYSIVLDKGAVLHHGGNLVQVKESTTLTGGFGVDVGKVVCYDGEYVATELH